MQFIHLYLNLQNLFVKKYIFLWASKKRSKMQFQKLIENENSQSINSINSSSIKFHTFSASPFIFNLYKFMERMICLFIASFSKFSTFVAPNNESSKSCKECEDISLFVSFASLVSDIDNKNSRLYLFIRNDWLKSQYDYCTRVSAASLLAMYLNVIHGIIHLLHFDKPHEEIIIHHIISLYNTLDSCIIHWILV